MKSKNIKILLAPNSFKECASSNQIVEILKENLSNEKFDLISFPISDGGDGFLEACQFHFGLEILTFSVSTPYNESKIIVPVGYKEKSETIYIESAKVLGLHLIPKDLRRPINLNSKGMGELIKSIQNKVDVGEVKVKKMIIGVGGSGTNDLGIGMCSHFGLKLYDKSNNELEPIPVNFQRVKKISWVQQNIGFDIEIIADVDNPLLGENGSTYVFGKQKGSTDTELELIESGFENLVNLFYTKKILDSSKKLSGAAGGLAAGFQIFFNSNIKSSKEFILNELQLNSQRDTEIVITGEGAFDNQSFMNKAPGVIVNYYKDTAKKIFIVAGYAAPEIYKKLPENCEVIELSSFFKTKEESIVNFEDGLILASKKIQEQLLN